MLCCVSVLACCGWRLTCVLCQWCSPRLHSDILSLFVLNTTPTDSQEWLMRLLNIVFRGRMAEWTRTWHCCRSNSASLWVTKALSVAMPIDPRSNKSPHHQHFSHFLFVVLLWNTHTSTPLPKCIQSPPPHVFLAHLGAHFPNENSNILRERERERCWCSSNLWTGNKDSWLTSRGVLQCHRTEPSARPIHHLHSEAGEGDTRYV